MSRHRCSEALSQLNRVRLCPCLGVVLLTLLSGCPQQPPDGGGGGGGGASRTFSADTTLTELSIPQGDVNAVANNAVVTVAGNTTIDGTLRAESGRITLRVTGDLTINGTLQASGPAPDDDDIQQPFSAQPTGIYIIVESGTVTFGESARVSTTGHVIVTDDDTLLSQTPSALYDEVENITDNELSTIAPLPPDNPVFEGQQSLTQRPILIRQQLAPPITISGEWPPAGAPPVPGDQPVVIFRFHGERPLNLDNWTVNGPPAPAGDAADQTEDPGESASGPRGKNGMRLNIRNDGGPINIVNSVVLNLADGGTGGAATTACANATGGPGGKSGNFRMSAAGGIDLTRGTLTLNPGRGGAGGDAIVTFGPPGATACPGEDGRSATGLGGVGGENKKRLLAQGNVNGIENITVGPMGGGDGGGATVEACDGGPGDPCCDGGEGGVATANGGRGGDASLNISGLGVATGLVTGGNGGQADATSGFGGAGGDCKFDDGGDGGDGANATATGGTGGTASNTGGGGARGGDGGDAISTGGDGGPGGDSGLGTPGAGGSRGTATTVAGVGGAAATNGEEGDEDPTNGVNGPDGEELAIVLYCITFSDFVGVFPGSIAPGAFDGPVADSAGTPIGTVEIQFLPGAQADYQIGDQPVPHIGISGGTLRIDVGSLELEQGPAGVIGGLRIDPLFGQGLSPSGPMVVRALDGAGGTVGEEEFTELPNNSLTPNDPFSVDAAFEVSESVAVIEIDVPTSAFVTFIRVYLIDP